MKKQIIRLPSNPRTPEQEAAEQVLFERIFAECREIKREKVGVSAAKET